MLSFSWPDQCGWWVKLHVVRKEGKVVSYLLATLSQPQVLFSPFSRHLIAMPLGNCSEDLFIYWHIHTPPILGRF